MNVNKTIIFLGDGMADEPIDELGGLTPLEAAATPHMDRIAREGRCGTLLTLPEGFPTSSDVANMSVLGCDLPTEFCGRGPLEAAGRGIELAPDDLAFRLNLTTERDGMLTDFSGGHPPQANAEALIDLLNQHFGSDTVRFHPGVSYRNLLVLSGPDANADVLTEKPDDNQGQRVAEHLPRPLTEAGRATTELLLHLCREAPAILAAADVNQQAVAGGHAPANSLWPWSGGRAGAIRTLRARYGISSAVISAVDVINGLGRCLGMDVIHVPGATGYIDTDYEGKAAAAIEAIRTHDLVYVHLEAIDEVSHAQDLTLKMDTIEQFDSRIVGRIMAAVGAEITAVVLPDHPVPISIGKHTRTPVPVAIRIPDIAPDATTAYSEKLCTTGALGSMVADDLMNLLFAETCP